MTAGRLAAYRCVRQELERDIGLDPEHAESLRDHAEGLLLSAPGDEEQAEQLEAAAALLLSHLVGTGEITDVRAEGLFFRISACGPFGRIAALA
jgi:hypothetical protein